MIILAEIADQANRQHLEYLREQLKVINFMYERRQIGTKEFEELREKILEAIESCSLQQRRPTERSLEFRF